MGSAYIPLVSAGAASIVQYKTGTGPTFGADIDVVLDAAPTAGNLLVLCVVQDFDGPGATYSLTNGPWTQVGSTVYSGNGTFPNGNWPHEMYYRSATGASDVTHVAGSAPTDTGTIKVFVIELAGVDTLNATASTNNTSTTTATITPTAGKIAALISSVARRSTGTNVLTPATGMTELAEIGPSPLAVNYRLIATTSGGYTVGSTGASANSSLIAGAFIYTGSTTNWVLAPDTIDLSDSTSDDVDTLAIADVGGPFWRYTADGPELIEAIDAVLGFESTGSVTLLLQGATLADYSDADTLAVLNTTATGGLTADDLGAAFDEQGPYQYYQLVLDSTGQDVRVFEVTLSFVPDTEPPPDPTTEPGKAILEIYVHDEDASRWGVAVWAVGAATGNEGVWSAAGWQDVTPEGVNAHILWGSRSPEAGILATQAGASWNVETYDPERILDPGNQDSPFYPQIVAGTPIRISHDSLTIRTGYIDVITYNHKPPAYTGQLLCTDTVALLNQAMVPGDAILGDTLLERVQDAINAAGVAVGGIPLPPGGPAGPAIAALDPDDVDERSVWDHITKAAQEVLWVCYVDAAAGLGLRSWGAPLDRGRGISAPNLEDLSAVSSEEGLYSVVRVQPEDPDAAPIERETAPLPRYGRRVHERTEPTVDPEGYAAAVLSDRGWPGVAYVPGAIHCFTRAEVDYFGSLEIMERVQITLPGVVSVSGRILGGELFVEHREQASQGATWIFNFAVATDGSSAIGLTTLVADGTGDTLVDDDTGTDYLEED